MSRHPLPATAETLPARFWPKVDRNGGETACWPWMGAKTESGYGLIVVAGHGAGRQIAWAHRLAYELVVGPIPEGLTIDHLCRVTLCVNPRHLEPVTRGVNTLRGVSPSAQKARQISCIQGHPLDRVYRTRTRYGQPRTKRACSTCERNRSRAWHAAHPDAQRRYDAKRSPRVARTKGLI